MEEMEVWDLSMLPPVLRRLNVGEIATIKPFPAWQHPPKEAGYTLQELADVIGYLKWVAGSQKEIKPIEVEQGLNTRSR